MKAIGEVIKVDNKSFVIVAVVENFHHLSLKEKLTPVLLFKSLKWRYAVGYYSFKISGKMVSETLTQIGEIWSKVYPGENFLHKFLDQEYENLYRSERNYSRAVTAGSLIAIFLACLGLLSFSRYNSMNRIKEIGIRKVFGATSGKILFSLNLEIGILVFAASFIALPNSFLIQ